jgi:hypothetical protein
MRPVGRPLPEQGCWKSGGAGRLRPTPSVYRLSEGLFDLLLVPSSILFFLFPDLLFLAFILVLSALISHGTTPFQALIDSNGADDDQN